MQGNSCFLIIDTPTVHRHVARKKCLQFGGDLAKITSAIENQFIFDLLRKQNTITLYGVWLGLHRKADTKFYWADDTPLTGYTAWGATEPSSLNEKCGHMIGYGPRRGKWNDIRCTFPAVSTPVQLLLFFARKSVSCQIYLEIRNVRSRIYFLSLNFKVGIITFQISIHVK